MASGNITLRKINFKPYADKLLSKKGHATNTFVHTFTNTLSIGKVEVEAKNKGDNKLELTPYLYVLEHTPTGYSTFDCEITLVMETTGTNNFSKVIASSGGDPGEPYYHYVDSFHYPKLKDDGTYQDRLFHILMKIPVAPVVTII